MDQFDTNDWKIPSGASSGPASYAQFQTILNNATTCAYIILEIISCLPSPSFFFPVSSTLASLYWNTIFTSKLSILLLATPFPTLNRATPRSGCVPLLIFFLPIVNDKFFIQMMFEAFGFMQFYQCTADTYLSYLRA